MICCECFLQQFVSCCMSMQVHTLPIQNHTLKLDMTLDQYLSGMETIPAGRSSSDHEEEDLYVTSRRGNEGRSRKIITYEIRESEQDEYQESHDEKMMEDVRVREELSIGLVQQRMSNKNMLIELPNLTAKENQPNNKSFRLRKHSNSPFGNKKKDRQANSPGKNFALTLFQGEWRNFKDLTQHSLNPSSTLYGKFLKGVKEGQYKPKNTYKQKHFSIKNSQQMEHVLKYEKTVQQKYNRKHFPQSLDMRIEGITDRYDRKPTHSRVLK